METGKRDISLTDREKLYEWICRKSEQYGEKYGFPQGGEGTESYFETVDIQPALEVYAMKTRDDIEKCMETFMDAELDEIKTECVRTFFKCAASLEGEKGPTANIQANSGIPDFIYTF